MTSSDIIERHLLVNSMCSRAKRYKEKLASILKSPLKMKDQPLMP